jgi:hypothetical protein
MAKFTYIEREQLEQLFDMRSGYVLDFNNRTFQEFLRDSAGIDIYDGMYDFRGTSKANRLRALFEVGSHELVSKAIHEWVGYCEFRNLGTLELRSAARGIADRLSASAPSAPQTDSAPPEVLTVQEVAQILRLGDDQVSDLVTSGALPAMHIAGQQRILTQDLVTLLKERRETQRLEATAKAFRDATLWARKLREFPDVLKNVRSARFGDDTFGSFLRKGLDALEKEEEEAGSSARFRVSPDPVVARDPQLAGLTPQTVKEAAQELQALLDSQAPEERVHQFLAQHTYFFNDFLRLYSATVVYSKVKLGSQHETDFAWFDSASSGPDWCLVELEGPAYPMFTKSGEPSARLSHAIQQVRDWNTWIHRHLDYARRLFVQIEYPLGHVFVGRRSELTPTARERLRRLSYEHRAHLHIHTLDRLVDAGRSVLPMLTNDGAKWSVPMTAYSHADLENRRPADAFEWLAQAGAGNADDRLRERESLWRLDNE